LHAAPRPGHGKPIRREIITLQSLFPASFSSFAASGAPRDFADPSSQDMDLALNFHRPLEGQLGHAYCALAMRDSLRGRDA
jgi:hypothetical protein